jgi:hypothetical protein
MEVPARINIDETRRRRVAFPLKSCQFPYPDDKAYEFVLVDQRKIDNGVRPALANRRATILA